MSGRVEHDPTTGMIVRSVTELGASASWYADQQTLQGQVARPDTKLAQGIARLHALRERLLVDDLLRFESSWAAHEELAEDYGIDFVTKAIHWGVSSGLSLPNEYWSYASSGDPVLTRSAASSTARNRTWEGVVAALAATFADAVTFEEPDITCMHLGKRVIVAAKAVYSHGKLAARITEGLQQCLRAHAVQPADAFVILVNVVGLVSGGDILKRSRRRRFKTNEEGAAHYTAWATEWTKFVVNVETLAARFRSSSPVPASVQFFLPLVSDLAGVPRPFNLTHLLLSGPSGSPDHEFALAWHRAAQCARSFIPGRDMSWTPP